MRTDCDYTLITDIGSTTTKGLLLDNRKGLTSILGLASAPTTVEKPHNDVRHGILNVIAKLEQQSGIPLLQSGTAAPALALRENVAYLSTSSAGGGLQILVIGLTLFDSASSGKRCAYGAGGVILDTFAIDDKRQAMEQMLAMRNLHPDMILICGGTDGGAVSGVLRLAELVRLADPAPKFSTSAKIPALFAGNKDAAPIIQRLVSDTFDLHILPNIRPSLETVNLAPTQAKIQQLFMENVMENAPGYGEVKPVVATEILPTPIGVFNSLLTIARKEDRNLFAFDIGGATTDVFSVIAGHPQRTVSANLGLSYSIWNVLRECGMEQIKRWLPESVGAAEIRNYIANKCLNPVSIPASQNEERIEQAVAREALSMALEQHRQMHYNFVKVGYLDKLHKGDVEKFELQFEFQREEDKIRFRESDIDILIGAGGIFAHTENHACAQILIDAIRPRGITELWIDRRFISPHLGVLGNLDPEAAQNLLYTECVEKLALHIAPLFKLRPGKKLLHLELREGSQATTLDILPGEFRFLPAAPRTVRITCLSGASLGGKQENWELNTSLPLIIDTRLDPLGYDPRVEQALGLSEEKTGGPTPASRPETPSIIPGTWTRTVELPYTGDVNYITGADTQPDDVVAVNRYNPPRLFIVNGFSNFPDATQEQIEASFAVKPGDRVEFDGVYGHLDPGIEIRSHYASLRRLVSPVRGKVEYIDYHTGIMVLSEIQDYSSKPTTLNYSEFLLMKPKQAKRFLLRQEGDFVYQGDLLARSLEKSAKVNRPLFVKAPVTGTITGIDPERGTLTIAYLHKPLEFHAHVRGKVVASEPQKSVKLEYSGQRLEGMIGFGRECHGRWKTLSNPAEISSADPDGCVIGLAFCPTAQNLRDLAAAGARGAICASLDADELTAFLGAEPGVINTGNEALPLTLIIVEGFNLPLTPHQPWNRIRPGANCYLNPHTRIRAGVVRPFALFQEEGV